MIKAKYEEFKYMENFVYIDEHGLKGISFYWYNYESKGLSKEDIMSAGLTSGRAQVHKDIIEPLQAVNKIFNDRGFQMYIKEGYRSKALYEIMYQRRCEKFGKEETDRLINMKDMPHASGKTVDIALWDPVTDTEVMMRDKADGVDGCFINFYKDKTSDDAKRFQELQDFVITTMQAHGFRLGKKKEYFHFDYKPDTEQNYE